MEISNMIQVDTATERAGPAIKEINLQKLHWGHKKEHERNVCTARRSRNMLPAYASGRTNDLLMTGCNGTHVNAHKAAKFRRTSH